MKTPSRILSLVAISCGMAFWPAHAERPPLGLGVNLAGAEFGSPMPGIYGQTYTYPGTAELDYYKAKGIELIRLPFRWERIQRQFMAPLEANELRYLDATLDAIEERGMRVILDMHNYARYILNGENLLIGTEEVPRAAYKDVWERIADHFKDRDCIAGYGIMNEPHDLGEFKWKDTAQLAVEGIRKHDSYHTIVIPGDGWSGAHRWLTASANLIEINDPAKKLIFEAHQYFDEMTTGDYRRTYDAEKGYPDVGAERLKAFAQWCRENRVNGFIGEYGVPDDDPRWITVLDRTLAFMKENGLAGTYWAGGPWWGPYKLSSEMRPGNKEAAQMAVLEKYGTGPRTKYWPEFVWLADAPRENPEEHYDYSPKSDWFKVDYGSASAAYSGGNGIHVSYNIPKGEKASVTLQVRDGVDLSKNLAAGHMLSFYVRGTEGTSLDLSMSTLDGTASSVVNTGQFGGTGDEWQHIKVPLQKFLRPGWDGTQPIARLTFDFSLAAGSHRVLDLDQVTVEKSDLNPPSVAVDTATQGSKYAVGEIIQAIAMASDAEGPIEHVEFLLNAERIGTAKAEPFEQPFRFSAPGEYRLTAIAFDAQGNPRQSLPKKLTVTAQ